jgi:hypothetical protein
MPPPTQLPHPPDIITCPGFPCPTDGRDTMIIKITICLLGRAGVLLLSCQTESQKNARIGLLGAQPNKSQGEGYMLPCWGG